VRIIITEWALRSYGELRDQGHFTPQEYKQTLRPDVLSLPNLHTDPKFQASNFWGPAQLGGGVNVTHGYKMKWHNMGHGHVQLRLCIALLGSDAYLCHTYVKGSPALDLSNGAKLESRIKIIMRQPLPQSPAPPLPTYFRGIL
jgi:hypothetical protein